MKTDRLAPWAAYGVVGVGDLLAVISAWGPCPTPPATCPANINTAGGSATTEGEKEGPE